jgi:hypothetical protein
MSGLSPVLLDFDKLAHAVGLIRSGGQFDYAARLIASALSNSAGALYPIDECMRC